MLKKTNCPQTQKIASEIFCAPVTDVATVWVPAGGIRKEKSTNGVGKCACRRYHFDAYQAKWDMTAMHWPKTLGGFYCLGSRKSKKGAGTAALAGWRHRAGFPGPRPGHGACDRCGNYYLHCWNCQIRGLEPSSIRQKNKIEKPLAVILHTHNSWGRCRHIGSPLLGGARLPQPWEGGGGAIKSGVIKSESDAVHNNPSCQLVFPWKICMCWEEQAAELLCSPEGCLSLGGTAAGNAAGSLRGMLQEKTTLGWEDGWPQ